MTDQSPTPAELLAARYGSDLTRATSL